MAKTTINISSQEAYKIPYIKMFEEEGIIEVKQGVFSKTYALTKIDPDTASTTDNKIITERFAVLLNSFDSNITLQFVIHNKLVNQEDYLKRILLKQDKGDVLNKVIHNYNALIVDHIDIGHNNVRKDRYFTISVKTEIADDAAIIFRQLDEKIRNLFLGVCEIEVVPLSIVDRMRVFHSIYNPNQPDKFGEKANLGDGFNISSMQKMKLTTKDIVAPIGGIKEMKSHLILGDNLYARSLFINNLPLDISDNMIADLTNVSSNMLFSVTYEAINSKDGFEVVAEQVRANTHITRMAKRDTLSNKKNKVMIDIRTSIKNNEKTYFNEKALDIFKNAASKSQKVMMCSFIITLFADNIDILNRDTQLVKLSASKYLCQVKRLDLQQLAGFNSSLPLGFCSVNVKRVFAIDKIANVSPLGLTDVSKRNGVFYGLNALNDNLILLNRCNSINTNGMIVGVDYSGKTYQCKREIVNALIGSGDNVRVITTTNKEYEDFTVKLGGKFISKYGIDIFKMDEDYGFCNDSRIFKTSYITALFASVKDNWNGLPETERKEKEELWTKEMDVLENYLFECNCNTTMENVRNFLKDRGQNAVDLLNCLDRIDLLNKEEPIAEYDSNNRFMVYKANHTSKMLMLMDHIWNEAIINLKKDIPTWIFIDAGDELIKTPEINDYLLDYLDLASKSKTVFTLVIQSAVQLINDNRIYLDMVISAIEYIKLLNQGPIERRYFAEKLNIPNSLLSYITNVEPGEGLLITSTNNIAFDDSFVEDENNPFYDVFCS